MQALIRRPLVLLGKVLARLCAWTFLFALVAGAALCAWPEEARAAYQPNIPSWTEEARCPVAAEGGTVALTAACSVWEVASGSTDTTYTIPPAATMPGKTIGLVDTAKIADTTWLRLAPAAGETLDYSLAINQQAVLPQSGAAVRLVSNGTDWRCLDGCPDLVVWPPSVSVELVAWLDPLIGVQTAADTDGRRRIANWSDQSGNGRDFVETAASGPIFAVGPKGLPAGYFNGTSTYLRTGAVQFLTASVSIAAVLAPTGGGTIFATDVRSDGGTDDEDIFLFHTGATSSVNRLRLTAGQPAKRSNVEITLDATALAVYSRSMGSAAAYPVPAWRLMMWAGPANGVRVNSTAQYKCTGGGGCLNDLKTAFAPSCTRTGPADCALYLGQRHSDGANSNWWRGTVQTFMVFDGSIASEAARIDRFLVRRHRMR